MKKLISLFMAVLFLLGTVPAFADESIVAPAAEAVAETIAEAANVQTGEFTGTIIDATVGTVSILNEFGTILTFSVDPAIAVPAVGSTVTVGYAGDLVSMPALTSIVVIANPVIKTDIGSVTEVSPSDFTIEMMNGNEVAYRTVAGTAVTGKSSELTEGQEVSVNYVDTAYGAIAVSVEVNEDAVTLSDVAEVATIREIVAGAKKENKYKRVTGKITKITGSTVTIKTKRGKKYTFKISGKTKYSGKYKFVKGATITVAYRGKASKCPLAKFIKIKKPAR